MFDLFFLDNFGSFIFGVKTYMELTSKSGDQILPKDLC